jgi:tRNA nucleotidyltransferase/poly(A) polymerase
MARKEVGYLPGTRTPIIRPGTLYDDLERRDFTLNALAKGDDGKIVDFFNGMEDLKNKILRTPLDTKVTFDDDPLRILRAIRFSIVKGFSIPDDMWHDIYHYPYNEKMGVVSAERIKDELFKCFKYNTLETLEKLHQFPHLRDYIFENARLWLKPTFEE